MSQYYRGRSNGYKPGASQQKRKPGKPKMSGILVVLGLLVIAAAGIIYIMNPSKPANADPSSSATQGAQPAGDKFAEGVYVDDIPLGGLTRSEAEQMIKAKQDEFVAANGVTLTDGSQSTLLKLADTDYTYDTEAILDQAYQAGRDGADLTQNPVKLTTKITADPSKLEQTVRGMAEPYAKPAVDAAYVGFDMKQPPDKRIQFSPDTPGQQVDAEALWASVKQAFASGNFGTVQIQVVPVPAAVTLAALQADWQLQHVEKIDTVDSREKAVNAANEGHTFTTRIIDDSDERLKNIELAGAAVSGLVLPGAEFDFNKLTGNRTAEQGYQLATVDVSGRTDKGLGGGVCQVSGTLYNAVIRYGGKYEADGPAKSTISLPGLAVTSRDTHSVQSSYLLTGTDCTVDIGSKKNLKIRNDFTKPVLILMYYEKEDDGHYYEHCDIYGPNLPDGVTYDLARKNVTTLKANTDIVNTVFSKYAPTPAVLKAARNGTRVDVYLSKTVNGKVESEKKIYTDRYDPEPAYWYVNPKDPNPPNASPSSTIEEDITPPPDNEPTPPPPTEEPTTSPESTT